MSALASILARDNVLSVSTLQEAIQEQAVVGGNLDTVLLELDVLPEDTLAAYCAAVYGLVPATREEVMNASVAAVSALPREFAVRYRVLPVSLTDDEIVLVVDRPLPDGVFDQIERGLQLQPAQRVTTSLRLETGLAHHYDIRLTYRMRQLAEHLAYREPGSVPYVKPYRGVETRSSLPPQWNEEGAQGAMHSNSGFQVSTAPIISVKSGTRPSVSGLAAARRQDSDPPNIWEAVTSEVLPKGTFNALEAEQETTNEYTTVESLGSTTYSAPPPPAEHLSSPPNRVPTWRPAAPNPEVVPPALQEPVTAPVRRVPPAPQADGAVPPRKRRRSSVIVNLGAEVEQIVEELWRCAPDEESLVMSRLLSVGEVALPALIRDFPGALWFDRHQPHQRLPRGRDISAVARTLVAFGQEAVPYLLPLLDHSDADVRYYATLLSAEFDDAALVVPVGRRVFDPDHEIRAFALRVLFAFRGYETEFSQVLERLRAVARDRRDTDVRVTAIDALGRLRDISSLDFLVSLLGDREREVVQAAHASLVRLCCQDFGISARRWRSWIAAHQDNHRVEWLIEGLTNDDEKLRRRASEELQHLTHEYFGYHPSLPKRDRETAQRRYRQWWVDQGSRKFGAVG